VLSSVKKVGVVPKVERKIRKRKVDEAAMQMDTEKKKEEKPPVKYVGETSRSGYERIREHFKDFNNLSSQSHMLKHFIETHKDMKMEDMRFGIKVLKTYTSAFERQIGESVWINHYLTQGITLMNSKNEYNRCIIPRLAIDIDKDEEIAEFEESEKEKEVKREIQRMKEKLRYDKQLQKAKRRKVIDNKSKKEEKENEREANVLTKGSQKVDRKIMGREERVLLVMKKKERLLKSIKKQSTETLERKLRGIFGREKDRVNEKRKRMEYI